ncbi:MAG: polysaccharide biosynthesis tyrosine autokinase [Candidatus Cloacimonetes bacterium]|jgi:capsular exopolysaccharide synthesis family protein|nr:polysaccharide biosynthesis tyrosine autokinase [Candidatus Cloacimonadota bacterium]
MKDQFNQVKFNEDFEEQEIKLTDYLNIIIRFKWIVASIFLAIFVVSFIYTAKAPRIYKATSKVLLEDKMGSNLLFSSMSNKASSINNNIQIIQSFPVMKIANQILSRHEEYKNFPISQIEGIPESYLKNNLEIDTERETDILIINFESTNPLEAKEAANAAAHALMQEDTDYARIEFKNAREFLANQLDEYDRRLRSTEEELRTYKIEHGISMLSEETQKLIEQSSDITALLSEAQTELDVADNHLKFLKEELTAQDDFLADVNSVLSSPLIEQLKQETVTLQTQYVNFLTKSEYLPDHPELVALKKSIESAKTKLNEEIQKILLVKSGSADPLMFRSSLIEKISTAQIDQNIKSSKVLSLRKAVEKYNEKMSLLPDTEVQLARLERNYKINEKTYTMLIENYEEAKIAEKSKIGKIRIVEEARIPEAPIKPNKKMNMMIAIVLGLGLGIGAALLIHSIDSKIRTFDDVRKYVSLPVLGTIPLIQVDDIELDNIEQKIATSNGSEKEKHKIFYQQVQTKLITNYAPKSSTAEAFRILRTNIISRKKNSDCTTLLITSSGPKEGKSTIQANMATALAQMDAKVILVDLDLRRPMVHTIMGMDKEIGISDFLMDKSTQIESVIKETNVNNLDVISSGIIPPNPSELLASKRMDEAIESLKEKYDYILFDSPPVIAVTDSMVMANKVDLLILAIRVNQADKNVVKRTKELLENIKVDIAGVVINGIQPHRYYNSYDYNYYYYYYYGKSEEKMSKNKFFGKNKPLS